MICDTLQHLTRYKGLCKNLDTAIDYLLTHDPASLPLGRTEVDGEEVFINTMDATLHSDDGYHPEYHKKYADLQLDITGSEGWGFTTNPGREIGDFTGDCGFQDSASVVTGTLGEGRFVLFFPTELQDARRAVQLDPGNTEYQMHLRRMQNPGQTYRTTQATYTSPGGLMQWCWSMILLNLLCNCCCGGWGFHFRM